jgi:hypothetical protein
MTNLNEVIEKNPLFRALIDNLQRPNHQANPYISGPVEHWTPQSLLGDNGLLAWKQSRKPRIDYKERWDIFWEQVEPLTSVHWFVNTIDACIDGQRGLPTTHRLYLTLQNLGRDGDTWARRNPNIAEHPEDVKGLLGNKGLCCWRKAKRKANKPGATAQERWRAFIDCAAQAALFDGTLGDPALPGFTNVNPDRAPLAELFEALDKWIGQ